MKYLIGIILGILIMSGTYVLADNGWVKVGSQQDWEITTTNGAFPYRGMRFHDDEKAVTCWVTNHLGRGYGASGGGISCLPDKELSTN